MHVAVCFSEPNEHFAIEQRKLFMPFDMLNAR
ncbi:hypothetical protein SAMN06273570_5219 [Candidatus Pantoea floridensis]|uniref:Uncharacterized protein n=1 Tax=Candidatus Pantoea floridensis TaxID=1938870 RepID=A0A286DSI1_9GAMM|nr:hypothetical protein BX596_5259 [Enterobacteriaceae bacterium JKS000233]SOD61632.1 hypothetical protein SAMN06273570_5219 [Pantoea floridensis]